MILVAVVCCEPLLQVFFFLGKFSLFISLRRFGSLHLPLQPAKFFAHFAYGFGFLFHGIVGGLLGRGEFFLVNLRILVANLSLQGFFLCIHVCCSIVEGRFCGIHCSLLLSLLSEQVPGLALFCRQSSFRFSQFVFGCFLQSSFFF